MNERIKELIAQAEREVNEVFVWWPEGPNREDVVKEKFALLIVRECAAMAESFHRHQYDMTGNLELHEFIREHFGVEE